MGDFPTARSLLAEQGYRVLPKQKAVGEPIQWQIVHREGVGPPAPEELLDNAGVIAFAAQVQVAGEQPDTEEELEEAIPPATPPREVRTLREARAVLRSRGAKVASKGNRTYLITYADGTKENCPNRATVIGAASRVMASLAPNPDVDDFDLQGDPIVPAVLLVEAQETAYQVPAIRCSGVRYSTPTRIRDAGGTLRQQDAVWCVPEPVDTVWHVISRLHAKMQEAVERLATELRSRRYSDRLAQAGGHTRGMEPLCPLVAYTADPDEQAADIAPFSIPDLTLLRVKGQRKQGLVLEPAVSDVSVGITYQGCFFCADEADWRVLRTIWQAAWQAHDVFLKAREVLGTYAEALADGRYADGGQAKHIISELEHIEENGGSMTEGQTTGQQAGVPVQMDIPRVDILPHPQNPRTRLRESVIEDITGSMRERGFVPYHAILVRPHPDEAGKYQVISGHHRLTAAKRAGIDTIPCWVQAEMTDLDAALEMPRANIQSGLTTIEHGRAARNLDMIEGVGGGIAEYARQIGRDRSEVSRWAAASRVYDALVPGHIDDPEGEIEQRARQLGEISRAPENDWGTLVQGMMKDAWSVAQTRKTVNDILEKIFSDEEIAHLKAQVEERGGIWHGTGETNGMPTVALVTLPGRQQERFNKERLRWMLNTYAPAMADAQATDDNEPPMPTGGPVEVDEDAVAESQAAQRHAEQVRARFEAVGWHLGADAKGVVATNGDRTQYFANITAAEQFVAKLEDQQGGQEIAVAPAAPTAPGELQVVDIPKSAPSRTAADDYGEAKRMFATMKLLQAAAAAAEEAWNAMADDGPDLELRMADADLAAQGRRFMERPEVRGAALMMGFNIREKKQVEVEEEETATSAS